MCATKTRELKIKHFLKNMKSAIDSFLKIINVYNKIHTAYETKFTKFYYKSFFQTWENWKNVGIKLNWLNFMP